MNQKILWNKGVVDTSCSGKPWVEKVIKRLTLKIWLLQVRQVSLEVGIRALSFLLPGDLFWLEKLGWFSIHRSSAACSCRLRVTIRLLHCQSSGNFLLCASERESECLGRREVGVWFYSHRRHNSFLFFFFFTFSFSIREVCWKFYEGWLVGWLN